MKYSELSKEVQDILTERFGRYGISGEYMYDNTSFFSSDMKELSDEEFLQIFDMKHISHIYPRSQFPEYSGEPWNIFLEDEYENISRGAEVVNQNEITAAYFDQISDVHDLDVNDDGIIDLTGLEEDFGQALDFDVWDFNFYEYLL